jgi:epoxyqueuosine reductase QueG
MSNMNADPDLTNRLRAHASGASLIGFADITGLADLPRAVVMAIAHSPGSFSDPEVMPTPQYYQEYLDFNARLDEITARLCRMIEDAGHRACQNSTTLGQIDRETLAAPFSHKMAATRAGLGWIGNSALLVTPELGPALRLGSLLTDAPLVTGTPITESQCGDCTACRDACPGDAISGNLWHAGLPRADFYDAFACAKTARARAETRGITTTICGICMSVCPNRPR